MLLHFKQTSIETWAVASSFFCSCSHSCASCTVWVMPRCDWPATSHSSSSHAIAFTHSNNHSQCEWCLAVIGWQHHSVSDASLWLAGNITQLQQPRYCLHTQQQTFTVSKLTQLLLWNTEVMSIKLKKLLYIWAVKLSSNLLQWRVFTGKLLHCYWQLASCLNYAWKLAILMHRHMWVHSFSTRLTSVTFEEDKVLIFHILRKNAKIVQLWV